MDKTIKPIERLHGQIDLPGDKSISHRVVFIGGISGGNTSASNFLTAEDSLRTVSAFRDMGIDIEIKDKNIMIAGKGLKGLRKPDKELYLGNSGTTMRILPGILAGQNFEATLTGDESLSKRPMDRIIEPLRKMGVDIHSKNEKGFPPLVIKGGIIKPVEYATRVASAQVKSCILFAGLYAKNVTSVTEPFISRDHTERMLKFCGAKISRKHLTVSIEGKAELDGKKFFIPGDISAAAFFIAGACILEGSDITIRNIGLNATRTGFLDAIIKMGADVSIKKRTENPPEPYGDIRVRFRKLKSIVVEEKDIPLLIDEVPVLAVLASLAEGRTVIKGTGELRVKETDRIFSITENLKRMGVDIRAEDGNLIINGRKKRFAKAALNSFKDHRTAMSAAVAALYADGDCRIKDIECINTSFPEFFDILDYLK
ncbi:MAG: 3-phosphoshikimate 1-carboxyvinyltransferase [Candidatus Omnitrophota bacterium]|nr:MAG: 3-phosphoshikimate 1-carboxyvinyltransferase [Candidatus Omnitrophota bacterium]